MVSFERIALEDLNLEEFNGFEDKSVFTSIEWLRFLEEDTKGEIVILRITEEKDLLGYLTGLIVRKFGIRIFGSPFKGWSTRFMSFDLFEPKKVKSLLTPTIDYLFHDLKCHYVEIVDRNLSPEEQKDIPYETQAVTSLEIFIDRSDEEILASIKRNCRQMIKQFESRGATAEIAQPDETFARVIHELVCQVFARQNLAPTYSLEKIQRMLKHMGPTGQLACITAKDPQGQIIGAYIGCGMSKRCFGWCIASRQDSLWYRPNEYLFWSGMRFCRGHGREIYDFSGVAEYKYKWNPREIAYLRVMAGKFPFLIPLRNGAKNLYWKGRKLKGLMMHGKDKTPCGEEDHES